MIVKKLKGKFIKSLSSIFSLYGYEVVRKEKLLDYILHEFSDYEEYRKIQVDTNKTKIKNIWADEKTLIRVSEIVKKRVSGYLDSGVDRKIYGLCHGTRNGYEQSVLNSLGFISAIGTDISETAFDYETSTQWDFHDVKDEWVCNFDFVYSNALDQSWKPKLALSTWLNQVHENGVVIIEHTDAHGPINASKMDPFGVRPTVLPYILTLWFGEQVSISHSKDKKSNMDRDSWLFVISKNKKEIDLLC